MMNTSRISDNLFRVGYAKSGWLFSTEEIIELEVLLDKIIGKDLNEITVSEATRLKSRAVLINKTMVYKKCKELASFIYGQNCHYSFDHAIYKSPGSKSKIEWHQDQAYQKLDLAMRSIHFWIPLQNTGESNGGIRFISGSHEGGFRTHFKNSSTGRLFCRLKPQEKPTTLHVERGCCTLHLPTTVHSSSHNLSEHTRKAWILHFSPYGKLDMFRFQNFKKHTQNFKKYLLRQ
ncbi:hypothetical protein BM526_12835 [Alteromonas mediterranea]|uniref:phytanoyl-CoA dioxygenase family protein n=1 Tax=Alteromonas mediterranea TaxID=314275 RepID=UPI00090357DA|nr:phytanoyl-CoA dioxygenase family protein [Alteromonas mediterranea]APE02657.1 hypothetical protein BM526_12835 [Alteromonas mediterranea]